MQTREVLVTPDLATEWLTRNHSNRPISKPLVVKYAHDMAHGRWVETHQGIAFDEEGYLRDGQHRLAAIVLSNTSVVLLVTEGLPFEAQRNMDRGRPRRVADFLGSQRTLRVSSARMVLALRDTAKDLTPTTLEAARQRITDGDLYEFLDNDPIAGEIMTLIQPAKMASPYVPVTPTALIVAAVEFPEIGHESLTRLRTGADLQVGNPLLAFRNSKAEGLDSARGVYVALRVFKAVAMHHHLHKVITTGTEHLPIRVR